MQPDADRSRRLTTKRQRTLSRNKILVADDSPVMLEIIREILVSEGYEVSTVNDGIEALAAIASSRPDLLITDIQMPGLDGLELTRKLKEQANTRDLPVLILTSSVEDNVLVESLGLGVEDYVRKPFSPAEIPARVAAILSRRREKEVLRATFERYVAPEVVQELVDRDEGPILSGEKKHIVALFCDIRGFTSIAQDMDPREVVTILNSVFTIVSEVVLEHRGMVDKFIGDGAMAVFGAPIAYGNEAERAVRAALDLQTRMAEYNRRPQHTAIALGIGIHSGEAIVGSVGSVSRLSYTAIGNCVNIAARLQGIARPGQTIVSRAVIDEITPGRIQFVELEPVPLKGLREKFPIFGVSGYAH